jgi:hypothetical protein
MDVWVWFLIVAGAVLMLAWLVWAISKRRRSEHLKERFGPEYERAVGEAGKRREAEQELIRREKRYEELEIRPLAEAAQARYRHEWQAVQTRFVDDPEGAVRTADTLVVRVMKERGFPSYDDVEERAADLSVEHADVVGRYRNGHELLAGLDGAEDRTESLRQAMRSFRAAFEELLEDREVART